MLSVQMKDIRSIVNRVLGSGVFEITPIGNHELGRHLVYLVQQPEKPALVCKLYYKHNRRIREIAALTLLENSGVKCARIVEGGTLPDGTEWLLTTFMPGFVLDRVWERMSPQAEKHMFESMGEELGKIHAIKVFDYFGHWNEKGESLYGIRRYFTEFVRSSEYVFRHLLAQDLPDHMLFARAINMIRRHYDLMAGIHESRLTHHDYDGRNILVSHENGVWKLQGVIDFEQSYPGNREIDLAGIYARYLMGATQRDRWFFRGYEKHMSVDPAFFHRLPYYLLCKGVVICSWTYYQAPEYYREGLQLIERFHTLVEQGRALRD